MIPYTADLSMPNSSSKRAWTTAKKVANVECRMHDLRHGFVFKLAETQTADATISALSGWMSRKILEHQRHVRTEAKRKAVEMLDSMHW
jgi:integrase